MTPAEWTHTIHERFEKVWSFDRHDLNKPSADKVLQDLIAESPVEIQPRLTAEFFAYGPLEKLISDKAIIEIVVNGAHEIWFERDGRFQLSEDAFLSEQTFKNFVDRLCSRAAIKVDLAQPFADGRWFDFRVHLGCAPLTHCSHHLTLRRLPENPWTLEKLGMVNWCSDDAMTVLRSQIKERKNILFIGPTGSGKTSVLGACLKEMPCNERVVILEDTDELPRPNSASSKLLTRHMACASLPDVSLTDLVRQSLRMRPFRLVMGEVRGGEAKDLLLALATGHSGSLGTLHAADARQALLRLEMLVQIGAPQWSVTAIRQLIQLSVDTLVVCGNSGSHRRLEGIYKVAALESCGFLLEPLIKAQACTLT